MLAAGLPTLAAVVSDGGEGAPVALLHGVGVGPPSWRAVVDALETERRVLLVERPAPVPGGVPLAEQADAVARLLRERLGDQPVTVAGASGGATLALALAIDHPDLTSAVVVHEPLLGSHAPALADAVRSSAASLRLGALTADGWFRVLVGEAGWDDLDETQRLAATGLGAALVDDVLPFVAWEPTLDELASLRSRLVVSTVGARSGPIRRAAASALEELAGASTVVLSGVGHLVQFDSSAAFAALVAAAGTTARNQQ